MARSFLAFGFLIAIEAGSQIVHSVVVSDTIKAESESKSPTKNIGGGDAKAPPTKLDAPATIRPNEGGTIELAPQAATPAIPTRPVSDNVSPPGETGSVIETIEPGRDAATHSVGHAGSTNADISTPSTLNSNGPAAPASGGSGTR